MNNKEIYNKLVNLSDEALDALYKQEVKKTNGNGNVVTDIICFILVQRSNN